MPNTAIHPVDLPTANSLVAEDLLIAVTDVSNNANVKNISVDAFFNELASNVTLANSYYFSVNNFIIRKSNTQLQSSTDLPRGTLWFDDDYLYVVVSNNTIKRVTLESF